MNNHLLIDSEMLLMQAMCANEHEFECSPDVWVRYANTGEAFDAYEALVSTLLFKVQNQLGKRDWLVWHCFGEGPNFRMLKYPSYKGHRKKKPVGYAALKERAIAKMRQEGQLCALPYVESDDVISIAADSINVANSTAPETVDRYVVVSGDKDLDQVPGFHVWLNEDVRWVEFATAHKFMLQQWVTGDSADNIPGLPGVGPVKAAKLLAKYNSVPEIYKNATLPETVQNPSEYCELMGLLVRLLKVKDYNFQCRKPVCLL
jgi:DNA polymerase-1